MHGTLLQTLQSLMNDYSASLLLYKDGYYQIDSNSHAQLPGQVFKTLQSELRLSQLTSRISLSYYRMPELRYQTWCTTLVSVMPRQWWIIAS
ncbi:LXG domain-containing protein [Streptococcus equi]|uniref:LXG domain-containing protein n=1 Tax=Streptococcus equi TaxID=1336 RepID=UPI001E2EA152